MPSGVFETKWYNDTSILGTICADGSFNASVFEEVENERASNTGDSDTPSINVVKETTMAISENTNGEMGLCFDW